MQMKRYILANKKAYDATAKEYDKRVKEYAYLDKLKVLRVLRLSGLKKPSVLELGPGSGLCLSYFEKYGTRKTTAIDISPKMISVAKKRSPNTRFIRGDFLTTRFNEKYDIIFVQAFIHLFPLSDARRVLRKIYSLLANNGFVFIATTIHEASSEDFSRKKDYTASKNTVRYRRQWSQKDLLQEIKPYFSLAYKRYRNERKYKKMWMGLYLRKRHRSLPTSNP